jgi:hypothetical protein
VLFEAWTGVCPSVENMHMFGSKCFAVETSGAAKTLALWSTECQFLGYDETTKAWRLHVKGSVKVIQSQDVIFHESSGVSPCPVLSYPDNELEGAFLESQVHVRKGDEHHPSASMEDESMDNLDTQAFRAIELDWVEKVSNLPLEVEAMLPRQSSRTCRPMWKVCKGISAAINVVPQALSTHREMLHSPHVEDWKQSTLKEFGSWKELRVYVVMHVQKGQRQLGMKPVYVCKTNADGSIDQFKTRYIILGNLQKEGQDYVETSSPTAWPVTLKLMVGIGTSKNWEVHQMDVKTAFLHADVDHDIYLRIPDGFPESELLNSMPQEELGLKLHKVVYGLKQAGYLWMHHAMQVFLSIGFSQSQHDPCLFFMDLDAHGWVWVLVYVDDFTILASLPEAMSATKSTLSAAFQLKDLGKVKQILGLEVERDREKGTTRSMQRKYVKSLLKELGLENCQPIYSPMEAGLQLPVHGEGPGCVSLGASNIKFMRNKPYSCVLGSLNWLANGTCPDIAFACSFLGQHARLLGPQHWTVLVHIVCYLWTMYDSGILFLREGDATLSGYSDSDHTGDKRDYISFTGYVFTLANGAMSHKACKQHSMSKSSTEAEYMALYECTTQAVWLCRLLADFQMDPGAPLEIRMDLQSAIKMALRDGFSGQTKHVVVSYHYSCDLVRSGQIHLKWVPGEENMADICTKALP